MAERGKPLPFALKEQIKARTATEPVKRVARELGVSRNTAKKYRLKA